MKLEATPLDLATLSPAVQKALAPGPARLMVARGVVPLPSPGELATALYAIAFGDDATLAQAARATAAGLPEKVAAGVLGDARLDPRVLDWLADSAIGKPALIEALVGNAAVADATFVTLAGKGDAELVERVATNEQRLLRHPEIIGAMYTNPKARMSTVDRAVELAVRNQVRVPGLAAWDEIARALGSAGASPADASADAMFAAAAAEGSTSDAPEAPGADVASDDAEGEPAAAPADPKDTPLSRMSVPMKVRMASIGNAFVRSQLIRDPIKLVAMAVIKAPTVTDREVGKYVKDPSVCEDVIRYIASRGQWTKNADVKFALVMNPKNSLADSMRLLSHLREPQLKTVLRSKGIPSALVQQARKLIAERGSNK